MLAKTNQGLTRAGEIYQDRSRRATELQAEGEKIIGYLCLYPVLEMMTALDLIPFRLLGDMREPITKADTYLPTVVCPFLRSVLDLGLKDKYGFLDGAVMAHVCDVGERLAHVWTATVQPPYTYFLDTPHTTHKTARKVQREWLNDFQRSLESYTGRKLKPARLREAIEAHNQQRALVRELYDLRKPDPPLISGIEIMQTMVAAMSLPIAEGSQLLKEVIDEVRERRDGPPKKAARLLVWGSIIHDAAMIEMMENLDANVVMDDICVGSRAYFNDVKITDDPLDGLADHYLLDIKCPRTLRQSTIDTTKKDYMSDLDSRYGYLGDYAKQWQVNGVILQSVKYCDTHGYEVPSVRDYLEHIGLPSVYLEHDYSTGTLAPLATRVQGFLEVIGNTLPT